MTIFLTRF